MPVIEQIRTLTTGIRAFGPNGLSGGKAQKKLAMQIRGVCADAGRRARKIAPHALEYLRTDGRRAGVHGVRLFAEYLRDNHGDSYGGTNFDDCVRYQALNAAEAVLSHTDKVEILRNFLSSADPELTAEFALGRAPGPAVKYVARTAGITSDGARNLITGWSRKLDFPAEFVISNPDWDSALRHVTERAESKAAEYDAGASSAKTAEASHLRRRASASRRFAARLENMFSDPLVIAEFMSTYEASRNSAADLYSRLRQHRRFNSKKGRFRARQLVYSLFGAAVVLGITDSEQYSEFRSKISPEDLFSVPWQCGQRPLPIDLAPVNHKLVFKRPRDMKRALISPANAEVPASISGFLPSGVRSGPVFRIPSKHARNFGGPVGTEFAAELIVSNGIKSIVTLNADDWDVNPADVRILVPKRGSLDVSFQLIFSVEYSVPDGPVHTSDEKRIGFDLGQMGRNACVGAVYDPVLNSYTDADPDPDLLDLFAGYRSTIDKILGYRTGDGRWVRGELGFAQNARRRLKKRICRQGNRDNALAAKLRRQIGRVDEYIRLLHNRIKKIYREYVIKMSRGIPDAAVKNGCRIIRLEDLKSLRPRDMRGGLARIVSRMAASRDLAEAVAGAAERDSVLIKIELINPANTSRICPDCGCIVKRRRDWFACQCGKSGCVHRMAAKNIVSSNRMNAVRVAGSGWHSSNGADSASQPFRSSD